MYTLKLNKDQLERVLTILRERVEVETEYSRIRALIALIECIADQTDITLSA